MSHVDKWFPKPARCTCAYDAGWIYADPKCPVHKGADPYKPNKHTT